MPKKAHANNMTANNMTANNMIAVSPSVVADVVTFTPIPAQILIEKETEQVQSKEKAPKKETKPRAKKEPKEKEPKEKEPKEKEPIQKVDITQVINAVSNDVLIVNPAPQVETGSNNIPSENIKTKGRKPTKKVPKNDQTINQTINQPISPQNENIVNVRIIELAVEPVQKETPNVTMQACELDGSQCDKDVDMLTLDPDPDIKHVAKKRGRKPKGGKITQQSSVCNIIKTPKPNIILHLKCFMKDLQESNVLSDNQVVSFNFSTNKNDLSFDTINSMNEVISSNYANNEIDIIPNMIEEDEDSGNDEGNDIIEPALLCSAVSSKGAVAFKKNEQKDLWKKLKQLAHNLHVNNISDKKSCCFWDTYEFDNPPVHIPKHYIKDAYQVYGCFCSPECAVAYLMAENIDISVKFERYHLLNFIYGKIYNYERNIKPAPVPHYLLSRFDGNMNIQEYRSLLKKERLYLIVDKPLTRILPELHEDNDDFILNNKIIPSNIFQVNKKIQKNNPTKNIISDQFGIGAM